MAASFAVPPFAIDALVLEQDTYLLMADDGIVREPTEPLTQLADELVLQQPLTVGSVIVRKTQPVQLLAVVHDVECDPTWGEQGITLALNNIVVECARHNIESLALRPLACRHGGYSIECFVALLRGALARPAGALRRVWLVWPDIMNKPGSLDMSNRCGALSS